MHFAGGVREAPQRQDLSGVWEEGQNMDIRVTSINQGRAGIKRPEQRLEAGWSRSLRGEGWERTPGRAWDRAQMAQKDLAKN